MHPVRLTLRVQNETFAICRLDSKAPVPGWATSGRFVSITRTSDELSIVCPQHHVPPGTQHEPDWACLQVEGPLDFALTGILAGLTAALARAGISLFAVSTYETDYLLVQRSALEDGIKTLRQEGYQVKHPQTM